MMLGKRGRPPMKRTTSMTEFSLDLSLTSAVANGGGDGGGGGGGGGNYYQALDPNNPFKKASSASETELIAASSVTPRASRRHSADFLETASFLRACSLCKRPLIPGRDIFMYRGDTAFCSLECRQKQIKQDERKEKCSFASKKDVVVSSAAGSDVPAATKETVAAV